MIFLERGGELTFCGFFNIVRGMKIVKKGCAMRARFFQIKS